MSEQIIEGLKQCLKETDSDDDVIFAPRWYVDEAISRIAELEAAEKHNAILLESNRIAHKRIAELEKVAESRRWRHIGDLPFHEHDRILALYNWGYIEIKMADTARCDMDVTHWMPLPPTPHESEAGYGGGE